MQAFVKAARKPVLDWGRQSAEYLAEPIRFLRSYQFADLQPDFAAGLTVAAVMLPQAIAYALIAELPPEVGLYTAFITAIVAALWGSSIHLHTGPTNAASLLVLTTLLPLAQPGTQEFLVLAGMMAVLSGLIRLLFGLFRLGFLVNFVADSVITGFTAAAGILIGVNQLRPLMKLDFQSDPLFLVTLWRVIRNLPSLHLPSLLLGLTTIVIIYLLKRFRPKWPSALISLTLAALLVYLFSLNENYGVQVLGKIPSGLPGLRTMPLANSEIWGDIWAGSLAAAIIGLVEAMSIARAFAGKSGQRLDANQEFFGQGLSAIVAGFFQGYVPSGSFTRSAMLFDGGARTRMASIFSGIIVLIAALTISPLVAFLPRTALAGVLIYAAFGMADRAEIRRTQGASVGDTAILWATFAAALILPLQYAVLTGVFVSFVRYVSQTSHPLVLPVVPDEDFQHFESRSDAVECPQLGVLTIGGALYFGATRHVEDQIRAHIEAFPDQKYLLLRLHRVNHVDMTGIHMLEGIVRLLRKKGGDLYLMRVHHSVMERMEQTGFDELLGHGNFLPVESAVPYLFHRVLDPALCIYSCQRRVWKECQTLPKSHNPAFVPLYQVEAPDVIVPSIDPTTLYALTREMETFWLVDVREMAEWETEGFIKDSQLMPLPRFFQHRLNLPTNRDIVFVSRNGRRSRHLVSLLQRQGWQNIYNLSGGIVEWRRAGLPLEWMQFSAEIDPFDEQYE